MAPDILFLCAFRSNSILQPTQQSKMRSSLTGAVLLALLVVCATSIHSVHARKVVIRSPVGRWRDLAAQPGRRILSEQSKKGYVPYTMGCQWKVTSGNTLSGIARNQGMSLSHLLDLNPWIENPNYIQVGWILNLVSFGHEGPEHPQFGVGSRQLHLHHDKPLYSICFGT